MRNSSLVLLVISAVLISACGRMDVSKRSTAGAQMSENEAMDTLMTVPMAEGRYARRGSVSNMSAEELQAILEGLVESGRIGEKGRSAVATSANLDALNQIFTLLQSGQANSIMGLANGLISMNAGSGSTASSKLNSVLSVLNAALPIIMTIAPQYAPIIQALVTIMPLVINFISLFKKKSAAVEFFFAPRFA